MNYGHFANNISAEPDKDVKQVIYCIKDVKNLQIGDGNQMFFSGSGNDSSDSDSDTLSPEQNDEVMNCKITLNEELIGKLAGGMSTKWSQYGECMLQEDELDEIYDSFHKNGLKEIAYHILLRWSKKYENPTIQDLANCFEGDENDDEKKVMLYNNTIKEPKQHAITAPASSQQLTILPSNNSLAIMPQ